MGDTRDTPVSDPMAPAESVVSLVATRSSGPLCRRIRNNAAIRITAAIATAAATGERLRRDAMTTAGSSVLPTAGDAGATPDVVVTTDGAVAG